MSTLRYQDGLEEPEPTVNRNRVYLIASLIVFLFFFLLQLLSWFTERGGIFSVISAISSVRSRAPVIDVDESGLWLPFLTLTWLMAVGFCRLFDIQLDMSTRAKALSPALILVGGGFALDEFFGEPIITH